MEQPMIYKIGDKLHVRLLGYETNYSITGIVTGIVDYNTAEKIANVDERYYNMKSDLSDDIFTDRINQLFYKIEIENPLSSPFKVGFQLYISPDLYDRNLTTLAVENESFTFSFTVNKDIIGGGDNTLSIILAEIQDLISTKTGVTLDIVETLSEESLVDEFKTKLANIEEVVMPLLGLDTASLNRVVNYPFNSVINKMEKASDNISDATSALVVISDELSS